MSVVDSVPISIEPAAEKHVEKLGATREFREMLDKIRELVPDMTGLEVQLQEPYDTGDEDAVIFWVRSVSGDPGLPKEDAFRAWTRDRFPTDVRRHFSMFIAKDVTHAG